MSAQSSAITSEFITEHHQRLWPIVERNLHVEALTMGLIDHLEDAYNEAWLTLMEGTTRRVDNPEGLLTHTTACRLRDMRRHASVQRDYVSQLTAEPVDTFYDTGDLADVAHARQQLRETAAHLTAKLTNRQREALVLNRVHGFTCPQIAERIGITARGVEKLLSRAGRELAPLATQYAL